MKKLDISGDLGGRYLTHTDLPQTQQVCTIAKADRQLVGTDQKVCITLEEFPSKALGLNKTNLRRIAAAYSTDAMTWIGQQLLVYRSATEYQGEVRLCVRVCGPSQAPPDPICDPQGNAVHYVPQPSAPQPQPPVDAPQPQEPVAPPQPPVDRQDGDEIPF